MTISKEQAQLLTVRLRAQALSLRQKSTPLADLIPLLQESADAISAFIEQSEAADRDAARWRWLCELAKDTPAGNCIAIAPPGIDPTDALNAWADAALSSSKENSNG